MELSACTRTLAQAHQAITEKVGMNGPAMGWLGYIETTERNKGEEGKTFNPTVFSSTTIVTYYGMLLIGLQGQTGKGKVRR